MKGRPAIPKGRPVKGRPVSARGRAIAGPSGSRSKAPRRCQKYIRGKGRCKAWQALGTEYCIGHARQKGLVANGAAK